jgi:hypothetical protein
VTLYGEMLDDHVLSRRYPASAGGPLIIGAHRLPCGRGGLVDYFNGDTRS